MATLGIAAPRLMVVEDDPGDLQLLREAVADVLPDCILEVFPDGDAALRHLEAVRLGDAPPPDLVLLDLNLPRRNGTEVLKIAKADAVLKALPIVVLSTSSAPADVTRCYDLQANSYVVKATSFAEFVADVDGLVRFWFDVAERPNI